MTSQSNEPEKKSSGDGLSGGVDRRRLLKAVAFAAIGVSIFGVSGLVNFASKRKEVSDPVRIGGSSGSIASSNTKAAIENSTSGTIDTIKVVYFGTATQYTGTKEEYFEIESPVLLQTLLDEIEQRHPVFKPMESMMQILVNGTPTSDNSPLSNHDEVDFIPVFPGG
ncbi:MAG: MoaD/ThiS family protein [Thaumarchaeota archaeon]|nr:MoaD/ThiS family protein [Nitrososphaerota archaeon]MDG6907435.1 MoaD/ThiS family protein [Nitrososphaerota archaeon]